MSIHKREGKWQVKYAIGKKQRSRTFARKADAITFDSDIKRRRHLGPLLAAELDRETMTLDAYIRGPWRAHAATISKLTQAKYAWAFEKHLSELMDEPLIALDPPMLARHQRFLLDLPEPQKPRTASTVREVMAKLSGVLQIAYEHGYVTANAARGVRNVPSAPAREIDPLTPVEVELVLAALGGRDRATAQLSGHFGLRPQEIRKVPWTALGDGALMIGKAQTKATARRARVITGPAVAVRELRAWQLESGGRGPEPIIGEMSANALKLWGVRRLRPAVAAATDGRITDATLYTLRHSHASACHYVSGLTDPEIFRRLGHKHQVHYQHYAHIIEGIHGQRFDDLDALISTARDTVEASRTGSTLPEIFPKSR